MWGQKDHSPCGSADIRYWCHLRPEPTLFPHLLLSHFWRCLEQGMPGCLPLSGKSYLLSQSWETEWRLQRVGMPFSKVPPANNQPYLLENMRKQNSQLPFIFLSYMLLN